MDASAVICLKGEIHRVLEALRSNRRWASVVRFSREVPLALESPLLRALKTLYAALRSGDTLAELNAVAYTAPFLDVISAVDTSVAAARRRRGAARRGAAREKSPAQRAPLLSPLCDAAPRQSPRWRWRR
jgi:hypothetical protein